ncbi:TetR/AcrR family transcriptional regulator [Actinocatenispora rupis]|uniref:TetR family transcriptional regulator n=1 Tax=Actinocatenispora rupis TaxID=519421 RepID=A0A8J3NBV0_9ACTN|nr:TetR/AcrR family transcriptional regulator [Actinocatenispora rupis]GID11062.1 TetR family transcriptional regulator [Actinocatenispora rupis]
MESVRERLVAAGVELVLRDGADAVGLREIARRAGVSHGAPRRYFPTHRALLSAIARQGFADLAARFAAAVDADAPPREQLRALSRTYVGYAVERRGMFDLMFRHDLLRGEDDPDGPRLREATLPMFDRIVELVRQHRRAHPTAGRPAPAAVTAAALWANLHGVTQLWGWGSMQLALRTGEDGKALDRLVTAALDAHLPA